MANTTNLALYYADPATDGANNFNLQTMLNDNWVKLDNKFHSTTGHTHDGTAGNGPKIAAIGLANGAATDTVIGARTIIDTTAQTVGAAAPISTLLGQMGNMIKSITGKTNWYTPPAITLESASAQLTAATHAATVSAIMKRDAAGRAQVADPAVDGDIVNRGFLYNRDAKDAVRVATTANITLSATQTVDGIVLAVGDRVLVKNQTTAAQNGIYAVAAGVWLRAADSDIAAKVTPGMTTRVLDGTVNKLSTWQLTTAGTITLNTTALVFSQVNGVPDNIGIEFSGVNGDIQLKDSGTTDTKLGNRTITDTTAQTAGAAAAMTTLLGQIGNMIKNITGKPNWYTLPATTLEATKSHMNTTSNIHGSTALATPGSLAQRSADGWLAGMGFASHIEQGKAPLWVQSTTKVESLNADLVDNLHVAWAATGDTIAARDGNGDLTARRYVSTINRGTAPFSVLSDTVVTNLNVDMLDGKHGYSFMQVGIAPPDLNNAVTAGSHRLLESHTNGAPNNSFGNLLVLRNLEMDTIAQVSFPYNSGNITYRYGNPTQIGGTGSYSPWLKIWNEGNDGIGSGLDADRLHGMIPTNNTEGSTIAARSATGWLGAVGFSASAPQGTAPLYVLSTTRVDRLNAHYLDGYSANPVNSNSTIVVRDSTGWIDAKGMTCHAKHPDPPFTVLSNAWVENLHADALDGMHAAWAATPDTILARDGNGDATARRFASTATGSVPPFVVNSTANVPNLNADLLDGMHASHFQLRTGGGITDFNAALTQGTYQFANNAINGPLVGYGVVDVIVSNGGTHNNKDNWIWQRAMYTDTYTYFLRSKTNGAPWTKWEETISSDATGFLSNLATSNKTNLVGAINEVFTSASNGKTVIAGAIAGMGQAATGADTHALLATKIRNISKDATATASNLLAGTSAYIGGVKTNGTMVDRAGDTPALSSAVSGTTLRLRTSDGYRDGANDFVTITSNDWDASYIPKNNNVFGKVGTLEIPTRAEIYSNDTSSHPLPTSIRNALNAYENGRYFSLYVTLQSRNNFTRNRALVWGIKNATNSFTVLSTHVTSGAPISHVDSALNVITQAGHNVTGDFILGSFMPYGGFPLN
ncbi:pyocin knob domain-containing protein [Paenibacillus sp. L3-i20]|uniref:pyocin knob domain-containing protein n=1 Tax=Paenibacillus sp. L3-i20 TaxID=2905833 RepID=UPI001EDF1C17|nr:pyocin knob domain-containing protein [Paenibacillus sp. L3-i20]GKU79280.1 hypothetical protein L3i20_v236770 [Paenibacillus sp. L3-i20]